MASFLGNKAKESMKLTDEVIAKNMLAAANGSANAYLIALMTSTTPEVRAVFSASLSQIISGHSALTELALKREWANPYTEPREQLSDIYEKTQAVMHEIQH